VSFLKKIFIFISIIKTSWRLVLPVIFTFLCGLMLKENYLGQIGALIVCFGVIVSFFEMSYEDFVRIERWKKLRSALVSDDKIEDEFFEKFGHRYEPKNHLDRTKFDKLASEVRKKMYRANAFLVCRIKFVPAVFVVCFGTLINGFSGNLHEYFHPDLCGLWKFFC